LRCGDVARGRLIHKHQELWRLLMLVGKSVEWSSDDCASPQVAGIAGSAALFRAPNLM
jgi:hypothetical protein